MSEWRAVVGWPAYEVSDDGQVRRRVRGRSVFAGRPLKPAAGRYARVTLYRGTKPTHLTLHRLVLEAFVGPPPSPLHQAAHWDGNRRNNRLGNLRWALPEENAADKVRHGRQLRGERSPNAKLTWPAARDIRRLASAGASDRCLAAQFGVARSLINRIVRNEAWHE